MKFSTKVALLESFYVIFEKKNFRSKITKGMCDEILNSSEYKVNSRQGTVKMNQMNKRGKAVYEISVNCHSSDC